MWLFNEPVVPLLEGLFVHILTLILYDALLLVAGDTVLLVPILEAAVSGAIAGW
jgi:hypothetical protein